MITDVMPLLLLLFTMFCTACNPFESSTFSSQSDQKGEYIYRTQNEYRFQTPPKQLQQLLPYPWEQTHIGQHLKITKDFFRCKGSSLNPIHNAQSNGETLYHADCGGSAKHSLPLRDGKEFIYPILIDLLNYIQAKTEKRVVITSGHRCPDHNTYVDSSKENAFSKHTIGAEVSFYVQGLENKPESIVSLLQTYYKNNSKYSEKKEYIEFSRYEKPDINTSTLPWYNKEIFIKLFKKNEGRNFDNRHPYPYISIQVRFDTDKNQKVTYSWDKAFQNYLRY